MLVQIFANQVLSAITQVTTETVTGFLPMVGHEYSGADYGRRARGKQMDSGHCAESTVQ
jgi:hypothetical protein